MSRERGWALAGVLAFLACLLPFACSGVFNNDELTYLSHARRMLTGELPYRDFFEFVPPISLWLLAAGAALGGAHLVTAHALAAAAIGVAGGLLYRAGRLLELGPALAWLPVFALLACLFTAWPVYSHHWVVLPFDVAAALGGMVALGRPEPRAWAGVGVAVGLAGFTVQTDGAALGLALAASLVLDGRQRARPWPDTLRRLGWLAAGAAGVAAALVAVQAAQGTLGAAFEHVVRFPFSGYRQPGGINDFPFATDLPEALSPLTALPGWYVRAYLVIGTLALLPLAVLGALAWLAGALAARGTGWGLLPARFALVGLWALGSFWLATRTGRSDLVHVAQSAVPAVLWLAVVAAQVARRAHGGLRYLPLAALVAYVVAGGLGQAKAMAKAPDLWLHPGRAEAKLVESPIIAYLRAHARPGDTMAAMPYGGFFYVFALPPASRYTLMLPGWGYVSPAQYAGFWAELARKRPRYIVISPWGPFEQAVKAYTDHLPPRYRRVAELASPQYNGLFPAVVYEAEEARP